MLLAWSILHAKGDHTPTIVSKYLSVDPIMNNNDPGFMVDGLVVTVPGLTRVDSAQLCEVRATVLGTDVKDRATDMKYNVVVIGTPEIRQVPLDLLATMPDLATNPSPYAITCRLQMKVTSGKVPLRPGMVRGNVWLQIVAVYTDAAGKMHEGKRVVTMAVSN